MSVSFPAAARTAALQAWRGGGGEIKQAKRRGIPKPGRQLLADRGEDAKTAVAQ